ncbi:MAG: hypothetical protein HKN13_01820 [Rhodothermales bacterium]|nr:hypothetical protein [Rhodothermales bacterium]
MPQTTRNYIDYGAVKEAVSVVAALDHYKALESFQPSENGDTLSGPCPICKATRNGPFRISEGSRGWYCVGKCRKGGNVLDLVAAVELTDVHGAAVLLNDWFDLRLLEQTKGQAEDVQDDVKKDEPKTRTEGRGYLRSVDKRLRELLSAGSDDETVRYVKQIVLESYRNGLATGRQKPQQTDA